jgi:O-antigen ligase
VIAAGGPAALRCPPTSQVRPRTGVAGAVARALLVAIVPLSLFWFPIGHVPGAGNVTAADAALLALWAVTAWEVLWRGPAAVDLRTGGLVAAAVLIGALAGLGSELSTATGKGFLELSLFMKRFGLAAVLPLAARLFAGGRTAGWTRVATLAGVAALTTFTLVPELQASLPRPDAWDAASAGDRATGPLTNPNDLAYAAVGLAFLHAALVPRRPGALDRVLLAATLAGSATCLVSSASRSGLLGAGGAVLVLLASSGIRVRTKLLVAACVVACVAGGLASNRVFQERVNRLYAQGRSEENVSSRLAFQALAVRASLESPLGVGFTNFAAAGERLTLEYRLEGSDSVYCDTLLGAGFGGLAVLLLLFRGAWRHAGRAVAARGGVLRAGLAAFLLFGTAAVIPISVFLSPLFFSLVAAAAYPLAREGGLSA